MVVNYHTKDTTEHEMFPTNILGLVLLFWIGLAIVFTVISVTVAPIYGLGNFSLVLAVSTGAFLVKEFFVRYAFMRETHKYQVLFIHGALVSVLFLGAAIFNNNLGLVGSIFLYGAAHIVASAVGYALSDIKVGNFKISLIIATFSDVASGGMWAALSSVIYSLRANAHTIIVAAMLGTTDVAQINATRVLVTPATLLIPTLSNLALPRFSRIMVKDGVPALMQYARNTILFISAVAFAYSVILIATWPFVASIILGDEYANSRGLVTLWCIYAITLGLRSGMEWSSQAMRLFKQQTKVYTVGAVVTLVLVFSLTKEFSVYGAVYGAISGELIVAALLALILARAKKYE